MDSISILQSLIKIPSFSREENDVADFFEKKMREVLNLNVQRHKNNLWFVNISFYVYMNIVLIYLNKFAVIN